ncbi:hypothetical protein [Alloyangia pacifica]|uniref:hypothetical protein n=1 Tax=Alloyangia pacifica TaxID=311180 RepID=UPI001CD7EA02|nr:hypothetical protein [Alloyangia pacifica]MCA0997670.1 hypothetical protein [Alloyangia pacifica]
MAITAYRVPCATAFVVLVATAGPLVGQISEFCTADGDESFTLGFDVKPSMVVHSDAVLDSTRGDLGLDGDATERAFSFSRTIATILETGGVASDAAAQEAFVQTMLDSFVGNGGKKLNTEAGIFMPFDERPEEQAELTAAQMLDDAGSRTMVPLAMFNRFDLAPETWSHCGEHRIVYGLKRPEPNTLLDRFLLIFEAMVPNPAPEQGERGCRRVTEFWAGLSGMSEAEQAAALSGFYYDGITGHADGDLAAFESGGTKIEPSPVVNFRNYGGDGNRGQVRANAFMRPEWQLREWLTQLTFDEAGPPLAFVSVTVKDNPLVELYKDDVSALEIGNVPAAVDLLHAQFVQALGVQIVPNLMPEGGQKHTLLNDELGNYDLGATPVTETEILLNTIALGNADKFNEFQSTSSGLAVDIPGQPLGEAVVQRQILDALGGAIGGGFPGQTGAVLLNRAGAASCQGCHETSVGTTIRAGGGDDVVWPAVAGRFVHVSEADRSLSPALENAFLPFRRYVMGRHLCTELQATEDPVPTALEDYKMMLSERGVDVRSVATSERYVSEVIGTYLSSVGRQARTTFDDGQSSGVAVAVNEAMSGLSRSQRETLRLTVARAIDAARAIERQTSGAFVETRRPH